MKVLDFTGLFNAEPEPIKVKKIESINLSIDLITNKDSLIQDIIDLKANYSELNILLLFQNALILLNEISSGKDINKAFNMLNHLIYWKQGEEAQEQGKESEALELFNKASKYI